MKSVWNLDLLEHWNIGTFWGGGGGRGTLLGRGKREEWRGIEKKGRKKPFLWLWNLRHTCDYFYYFSVLCFLFSVFRCLFSLKRRGGRGRGCMLSSQRVGCGFGVVISPPFLFCLETWDLMNATEWNGLIFWYGQIPNQFWVEKQDSRADRQLVEDFKEQDRINTLIWVNPSSLRIGKRLNCCDTRSPASTYIRSRITPSHPRDQIWHQIPLLRLNWDKLDHPQAKED